MLDGSKPEEYVRCSSWSDPVPFDERELPAFPTGALPDWLADWVEQEAEMTQTPEDLAGLLALGVVAAAATKVFEVEVRPGWLEPCCLYAVAAMAVGERKTKVFRDATRTMRDVQLEVYQREVRANASAYALRGIAEATAKQATQKAVSANLRRDKAVAKEFEAEAAEAAGKAVTVVIPPVPPVLLDDATIEVAGKQLLEQGGRLGWFCAEGSTLFEVAGGLYHGGRAQLGVLLKGHAGDAHTVSRLGRDGGSVRQACLTLLLAVQPDVIRDLHRGRGFRGLGLLARFVYAIPESRVGARATAPQSMSEDVARTYEQRIRELVTTAARAKHKHGEIQTCTICFGDEARETLESFAARLEPRLGDGGDLHPIADWGGKLCGLVARFAGLLALADVPDRSLDPDPAAAANEMVIDADVVERAIELGQWALAHAQAAFDLMAADPAIEDARYLLGKLKSKVSHPSHRSGVFFSRRDAQRWNQKRWRRAADLDQPLRILAERGYIHPIEGGKYEVHPDPCDDGNGVTSVTADAVVGGRGVTGVTVGEDGL